jgi:plasmid stability protein
MARAISLRQIDERLHQALRQRAARAGLSVEAEIRAILTEACLAPQAKDWAEGLRERARARTAGKTQTDSADLIREARDAH